MKIKTLLIGLDGATFSVLDPLMQQGVMPFLRSFLAEGARADLRTIVPALTPPAWTSLMTGRTPGYHGVFDFFRMESPDSHHIRFFTSNDVNCDTIWSLASEQGLRVTSLNFPSMFPAPKVAGYVVPGWVPWRQLRLACWPESLFDRLKGIPGFNPRELAMDYKLEEKTTEGCENPEEELGPWIELHIRREHNWFEIYRHLTAEDPSELTAVLFDGVDKLQHLCWRFLRPEDDRPLEAEWELRVRALCLDYFRSLDSTMAQMCSLAGPDATVLLASDHGFGPTREVFHINNWLQKHGYLAWSDAAAAHDKQGAVLGVGQVARHTWLIDWSRTKAFAATPTSNGVYIVVSRDGSPGISEAEYPSFRERLKDDLLDVRDPATGETIVEQIWTREEAFSGPSGSMAPDLTLAMRDGGLVSILPGSEQFSKRPALAGAHRPVGVFGARGPNVRHGLRAGELSILDVAPLVLYSLGLPVGEEMQGRVPQEIMEPAALATRPPTKKASTHAMAAGGAAKNGSLPPEPEDEQVVLERLRELGYIE